MCVPPMNFFHKTKNILGTYADAGCSQDISEYWQVEQFDWQIVVCLTSFKKYFICLYDGEK